MKISAKGKYGIASMVCLAMHGDNGEFVTIISIAQRLGISKIYLEQVFALLKRAGLVQSTKGSSGGYRLSRSPDKITAYDIISSIEQTLFEKNKKSLSDNAQGIEKAMQKLIFKDVDDSIKEKLQKITLGDLLKESKFYNEDGNIMYYI